MAITFNVLFFPLFQIYWIGPIVGSSIAAFLYDLLFAVNASPAKAKGFVRRDYDDANYGSKPAPSNDINAETRA